MEESFDFGKLLKNHAKKHKSKPSQFGSVAVGVQKRLEKNLKYRKSSRLSFFDNLRNLSKCDSPAMAPIVDPVQSKVEHRRQQLEKWKEEKEVKKKEAASKKKKPFLAGVPHAPLKFVPPPPPPKPLPSTSGRVTRSQSARNTTGAKSKESKAHSFAPKNASFRPPEIKTLTKFPKMALPKTKKHYITFDPVLPATQKETGKQTRGRAVKQAATETKAVRKPTERQTKGKVTIPAPKTNRVSITPLQSSSSSEIEQNQEFSPILTSKNLRKSLPPQNSPRINIKTPRKSIHNVTPNRLVPRSESSSEERLRSPKALEELVLTPEQIVEEAKNISPCVTMSRGKDNARKEMKKKIDEGLLDEDASNIYSVDHFRRQLASEIKRMTEMCDTWDKIMEQTAEHMPESVQETVLASVGQARLLMSQKLQQFASLVERCARPEPGSSLITPADLHGFWDMVFMQVENVEMRFKHLDELRLRGWVEDQPVEVKKKVIKPTLPVKKTDKPTGGPSRLREIIAAARKAKKEQEESTSTTATLQPPGDSKTFDAGFFSVSSPVHSPGRSPARSSASRSNLLKAVLSSEAKKASANKNSTSFAMLRASVFGKNIECDGFSLLPQTPVPMTPINLYATPGRSILKGTNTENKSIRKSIKMVLFNRSDADIQDVSYHTPDSEINELQETDELLTDSGISSLDHDKVENKENTRRKSKLVRQNAEDRSPVVTRSRRKSMNTSHDVSHEASAPRRSARRSALTEAEHNVPDQATPRRSARRPALAEAEHNVQEQATARSTRRRQSGVQA